MSDSEEDNFQYYGTLLEPYEEDAVPTKKAFSIEDQIATDDQGRRRFHGAFTGGFSAGFFNTVGSLEGWKPTEFKSSRSEKAGKLLQKPQDFMDDEDLGQFGIAPTVVRATSDYSSKAQKRRHQKTDGPIPGIPVLHSLLQPAKETVGITLLRKMGWKPGQGVGPRLTKSEKRKAHQERKKVYGCEIPEEFRKKEQTDSDESLSDDEDIDVTFAPDDYDLYVCKPKDNLFGLGYSGLDRHSILSSHISLFNAPDFRMRDHKNKKISVTGQAFGVGAFENEDEDIYAKDDMSKYDFELESSNLKPQKQLQIKQKSVEDILEGFVRSTNKFLTKKSYSAPVLPKNFIPKHGARISRFEPLPEKHKMFNYDRSKTMGRHDLSAADRSKILNSNIVEIITTQKDASVKDDKINKIVKENSATEIKSNLTNTQKDIPLQDDKNNEIIKENDNKSVKNTSVGPFKPFMINPDKQKRYEQFITLKKMEQVDQLKDIQPFSMSDWEREREKYEFEQAYRMFKPTIGLVFDKFVSASTSEDIPIDQLVGKSVYLHGTEEMRNAAKNKQFGHLTRSIEIWMPNKLLCKRFNVPEPDISESELQVSKRKNKKYNVFDYYEAYKQNKTVIEDPVRKSVQLEEKENEISEHNTTEITENVTEVSNISEKNSNISNSISLNSNTVSDEPSTSTKFDFVEPSTSKNSNITHEKELAKPQTITIKISDNTLKIIADKTPVKTKINLPEPTAISMPTDPKEKLDLFKAIFLSSSESEDEDDKKEEKQEKIEEAKINEMKKIVLEKESPKVRDISEKKLPEKKGIFADLDWSKINKPKTNVSSLSTCEENKEKNETESDEQYYGPILPKQAGISAVKELTKSIESSDDEWMEADTSKKSEERSCKKHKKHKSKHKKHKHKHKKKHR